jgi:hypothetical protein
MLQLKRYGVGMHTGINKAVSQNITLEVLVRIKVLLCTGFLLSFFPPTNFLSALSWAQHAAMKAEWCNNAHGL